MSSRISIVAAVVFCSLVSLQARGEGGWDDPFNMHAYKLLSSVEAKGVQVYKSVQSADGKLTWVFEGPLATLSIDGKAAGYHFDGPTWVAADGSAVKKVDTDGAVINTPAPNGKADISWLRIAVKSEGDKAGIFSKVECVLRVNTKGGQPPSEAPVRAGIRIGVDYSATYKFYGK